MIAALVALVSVGIGVALIVYAVLTGSGSRDTQFSAGETVTVTLKPDSAIYATQQTLSGACSVTSLSGEAVRTTYPSYTFTTTGNGREWRLTHLVHAPATAQYRVGCTGTNGTFAVGDAPKIGTFAGGLVAGILTMVFGLPIAVVIAIITGVKRGNNRRRLQSQRMGPPAGPF